MSFEKVRSDIMAAENARNALSKAMAEFHAAALVGDWDRAENARITAQESINAFFDNLGAAHKRLDHG